MSATIDISCVKAEKPEQEEQAEAATWETNLSVVNNNIVHKANLDVEIGPVKIEPETFTERRTVRPGKKNQAPLAAEPAPEGYTISFLCPHCPRQFERSDELEIHTQIHTDKLLYKCSFCPNSFSHKSIFTAHMYGHTGKFPYNCPDCPEGYLKKCDLKKHMLRHHAYKRSSVDHRQGARQCPQCPRSFLTSDELEIHLQIHSDKLPHKCPYCPDSFAHKSNFLSHVCEHTGEYPFKCPECQQKFKRKFELTRHLWSDCDKRPAKTYQNYKKRCTEFNKSSTKNELKGIKSSLQNAIEPKSQMDDANIENCHIKKKKQEQKQSNSSLQSPSIKPSDHNLTVKDKQSPTIKVDNMDVNNSNVEQSQVDDNILINTPLVKENIASKSIQQPLNDSKKKRCQICLKELEHIKDLRSHQRCCTISKKQMRIRQPIS